MKITKSQLKELIRQTIEEQNLEKVVVPAQVKRFMKKFVGAVKEADLNKIKKMSVLFKVIKALGISPQELIMYIQKIKTKMKREK
tara:strand:+ start:32 stop:286 length:255 start_codon:yes stop_codon:yes gene_type:complete